MFNVTQKYLTLKKDSQYLFNYIQYTDFILLLSTTGGFINKKLILGGRNMTYEKSCGAIQFRVIDNKVQYLILKSLEPHSYWGFAKGHMEGSETEEETCIREVFEETGIRIKIENNFRIVDKYKISEDIEKEVVIFLGNTKEQSVTIQQQEIMDYKWCNYTTAINLLTFEGSRNILYKANKFLMLSIKGYV